RAGGHGARLARRGAAGDRLPHGRRRGSEGLGRRGFSREHSPPDHLSGRADCQKQARRSSIHELAVQGRGTSDLQEIRILMLSLGPEEQEVLSLSLRVAFWSVFVSLPLAVAVAYALARGDFPGKTLFDAVVHLPLVLPPVVVGFFLLLLFGRRGPIG